MATKKKSRSGGTSRRSNYCSFCGKGEREVGPMIEGPGKIFICASCVELCSTIIHQEKRKIARERPLFGETPSPRAIKEYLDEEEWDGTVYIYEAVQYGHAFLVDKDFTGEELPEQPVLFEVTYFSPLKIELEGDALRSGILFVSEPYYPGWQAIVDGEALNVVELGSGFMGVPVTEGKHSIELIYAPLSFKLGFWISFFTIFAIALLVGWSYRSQKPGGPAPETGNSDDIGKNV